ncbi:MAG TPA: cytochrome c biogenesis protein CcdA [Candidatus Krumholzibacteriaceae bacterium]|nr:cytochrome c biogenesis protein CcdA [Candidatus Krumholzibacteriaceae bacterium]
MSGFDAIFGFKSWSRAVALLACLVLLTPSLAFAQGNDLVLYVVTCPTCSGVSERVKTLEDSMPAGDLVFYDVAEKVNTNRFQRITEALGETLYMPLAAVFRDGSLTAIASGGLSAEDWRRVYEEEWNGVPVYIAASTGTMEVKTVVHDEEKKKTLSQLFTEPYISAIEGEADFLELLPMVAAAAAVDAINPCCFNVFVILLSFVFYDVGRRAALRVGLAFSSGLFTSYFLLGLGLFSILPRVSGIKYLVSAVAIVFGGLRILDALGMDVKYLPDALAGRVSAQIEGVSNPRSGYWAGLATGILLLPCSSAPYFIVLNLLSERVHMITGLALIALYNLIIVAPFVITTIVVHGLMRTTMDLKLWSMENRRWVNLLIGVTLVLLGLMNLTV